MRLDKFLSTCFLGSRKEVKLLINQKKIKVNGIIINKEEYQVNEINDIVTYNDKIVKYQKYYYFMLNKPKGYISSKRDDKHQTVMDLFNNLPSKLVDELMIVGRLDIDTEGLLLITNDGSFVHHLTSPNHHIEKVYDVYHDKKLVENAIEIVKKPIILKDTTFLPSKLEIIDDLHCIITITEGQFHEVKRIIYHLGANVTKLKRTKIDSLTLPVDLEVGQYVELTKEQVDKLKSN